MIRGDAPPLRIVGVDPGSRYTGYGVIDIVGLRQVHVGHGRIDATRGELPERLLIIFRGLCEVLTEFQPHEAAIEETFVNRVNAASALVLGQARGTAICALAQGGLSVAEYAPSQIKMAVTGSGRADKQQVAQMVKMLLKPIGTPNADAADALAVAMTHAQVRSTRQRSGLPASGRWG